MHLSFSFLIINLSQIYVAICPQKNCLLVAAGVSNGQVVVKPKFSRQVTFICLSHSLLSYNPPIYLGSTSPYAIRELPSRGGGVSSRPPKGGGETKVLIPQSIFIYCLPFSSYHLMSIIYYSRIRFDVFLVLLGPSWT